MPGRGEGGRGRSRVSGGGKGPGPIGRGRGLQAQTAVSAPGNAGTPPTPTRMGRGLSPNPTTTTTTPSGSERGRGRGLSSVPAPPQTGSSPARAPPGVTASSHSAGAVPAVSSPASAASSAVLSSAPVVNLGIDLSDLNQNLPDVPLYRRPDKPGRKGNEIKLQSNLFAVEFKDAMWYKFDVEISTATEDRVELQNAGACNRDRIQSRRFNREIMAELFRKHHAVLDRHVPAYDGRKTLICARKFFDEHVFEVNMEANDRGRRKQFLVKLKCTTTIDVSHVQIFYNNRSGVLNPEVLHAANIVIDSSLGANFMAVNRSYYEMSQSIERFPLSGGKELRSGIYTSMVYAQWRPLLVVDKSNAAFYKSGPLLDYIAGFFNGEKFLKEGLSRSQVRSLGRDLKGVTMRLLHSKSRRYLKINSLTEESADEIQFRLSDETTTTVAKYFSEKYRVLKYPKLPCVKVLRSNGTKTDFFPLEVCAIKEDQPFKKRLNQAQTQNMIKVCQELPAQRMNGALKNVKIINTHSRPQLTQHGVTISEEPVTTAGRRIDSPRISVKDKEIKVENGRWRQDKFDKGASLGQWFVVDCAGVGEHMSNRLVGSIIRNAKQMGMEDIAQPRKVISNGLTLPGGVEGIFRKVKELRDKKKRGPIMVVMILGLDPIYAQIKRLSETVAEFTGIITQCIKSETLQDKFNDAVVSNLLKKMNVKLGGINHAIARMPRRLNVGETGEPFIVIGADVSHPGVGDFTTPSIAAVVGSLDYIPWNYSTKIRVQTNENNNRIEYIKDLEQVAEALLTDHYDKTRTMPHHIYYFRDGVSDGQFEEVKRKEIGALRAACKSFASGKYQPKMTVIIAQKRHHTRFNVMDRRDGCGKTGNVPPGTYIDRDVVHPVNFDFYMYTHQGIVGCSRPTHYHLIHSDDDTFTTDDITEIIYHLSHCYARTTSSVSIPAPIYYAHLAAFRAKEHVKGDPTLAGSDSQSSVSGGEGAVVDLRQYQAACSVGTHYQKILYYA